MSDAVPVPAAYAAWAASYDTDVNRTRDLDALVLRSATLPLDGAAVIELGAGTGKNTAYLSTRASRVLALDMSPAMLARARGRGLGEHVQFAEHDVTLPWPAADAAADLVIGNLVLEHVADLRPVFAEARRVLRPGGLLYVSELHPYRQLRGSVARFGAATDEICVEAHLHSVADYVTTGLSTGFALVSLQEPADDRSGETAAPPIPRLLQLTFQAR